MGGEAQRGSLQQASVGGGGGQKARSLEVSSKRTWEDSNLQRSVLHARGIKEIREATGPGAFLNAGGKNIDHQHQAGPKGPTDKRIPPAHGKKFSGRGGSILRAVSSRSFDKTKICIY